ncbi:GNAT family N-acetyltransferase [Sulfuriflexus sp.]|uniref:GNAT family N-acetyltransferase n=1 Tax=Sulfuriflexus sp. TaxID=2015443 RepID=UPI0028CBCD34|nr:GNAT family N-acetyltransferase [Sulfuriflexus sp.]MDT8404111.1 GNAT family N-acetyltransferase [Sulfuriflexus sp.]
MVIRLVEERDLEEVTEIGHSWTISGEHQDYSNGFLVSSFTMKEYREFIKNAEYFYLLEYEGEIQAFLLAYNSDSISDNETVNILLKTNVIEEFILIKQICVNKNRKIKGAASRLYNYLSELRPERSQLAVIVLEPVNEHSIAFHEDNGFRKLCNIIPPADKDGEIRRRGVWYRPPKNQPEHRPDIRYLPVDSDIDVYPVIEKQGMAISLYTHEDNLNWTKLGMLLTFVFALGTAFNHFINTPVISTVSVVEIIFLILFGNIIIITFFVKIKSGINYMDAHKCRIKLLDKQLQDYSTLLVPIINHTNISETSATIRLMKVIPILCAIGWGMLSILLIFHIFSYV